MEGPPGAKGPQNLEKQSVDMLVGHGRQNIGVADKATKLFFQSRNFSG